MPAFPDLVDYWALTGGLLDQLVGSGRFAPGLLEAHLERHERIRQGWDQGALGRVSSHNDPNPRNILFDGARLWLIDWESAYGNDPLVDVAIVLDNLAPTPELETALLQAWLGRAPDVAIRERLDVMRPLTRLYYASFLLNAFPADLISAPDEDLSALSPMAFIGAIRDGRLQPNTAQTAHALGKIYLDGFLTGLPVPGLAQAVASAMGEI